MKVHLQVIFALCCYVGVHAQTTTTTVTKTVQNPDGTYTVIEYPAKKEVHINLTPVSITGAKGVATILRDDDGTRIKLNLTSVPAEVTALTLYAVDEKGMVTALGPVAISNGTGKFTATTPLSKFMLVASPEPALTAYDPNSKVFFRSAVPEGFAVIPVTIEASGATVGAVTTWPSPTQPSPTPRPRVTPVPTRRSSPIPRVTPTPTPIPVFTPSPSPSSTPTARIDQILASMEFGNISFNVPPSMSLQKSEEVTLLLSLKQTSEQLAEQLKKEGVTGDIKEARIKIHDKMQAVIWGDDFYITSPIPDTLPVSKEHNTQWKWDVRAKRSGTLYLHVVLNAIVDLDDGSGPRPYPIKTFRETYVVAVPWQDGVVASFIKQNWTWLWATLIVPVAAWIWNRNRKKRSGPAGFNPPRSNILSLKTGRRKK